MADGQTWLSSAVLPAGDGLAPEERILAARAVIRRFSDRFNAEDVSGMDACLHFPHLILSGEALITWPEPGQMGAGDFTQLRATGWARSEYHTMEPVLCVSRKVHFVVEYTRSRSDGSIITSHRNIWIVTLEKGSWGIKLRSY